MHGMNNTKLTCSNFMCMPYAYLIFFQSIFIGIVLEMQFPQLTACK
jgi:hypothetical protein